MVLIIFSRLSWLPEPSELPHLRQPKMALTKTNTDALCPPTKGNSTIILWLQKAKYRYYLWTGLYMLETHERTVFHIVVGPIVVAFCLYAAIFVRGFVCGWNDAR